MLIDMKIKNFLSYNDTEVFSMETGERLTKYNSTHTFFASKTRLLKSSILFGANASGKTNLFVALNRMKYMLLEPTKKIGDPLYYSPFKLANPKDEEGTTFEVTFFKNRIYKYSISYNKEQVLKEKLLYLKGNKEIIYFERTKNDFSILPKEYITLAKETRNNSLFLFNLQNKNNQFATDVFKWFDSDLIFFDHDIPDEYLENIEQNDTAKKALLSFLAFADTNIIDIDINDDVRELPPTVKKMMELLIEEAGTNKEVEDKITTKKLYTVYDKYSESPKSIGKSRISLGAESKGNQKLISIALTLINNHGKNKVILIDEFDSALHLQLAKSLLKIFNTANNKNQFILSSHELQLLDCELRKDQIWLVEKDYKGQSHLFSIFDFNDFKGSSRTDITFFRRYMKGQFGAIPTIDYEGMMRSLNCE
ncbi:ATP-binding protein [Enterococcus faecalis]|uniref:AAA family ATPase n=1 Tax=Enterococcus faecalis TaxID=1351 RepID=UPI0025B249A2|nr:ATP-binding protein [Enterococcus faecalis]MDN3128799.1 ATP-binding protein [Enterococcus faecalis]